MSNTDGSDNIYYTSFLAGNDSGRITSEWNVGDSLITINDNYDSLNGWLLLAWNHYLEPIGLTVTIYEALTIPEWHFNANIYANKVYNAVWNDIADYQELQDKLVYGKCYYDTKNGAKLCNKRCQMGVMGIASDTFGFGVGKQKDKDMLPIAIGGWVLAHVDKEYDTGTPLTNDENGDLTEITLEEKHDYPERIVATYKKPEKEEKWGPEKEKINVNGRHWVKVK